MTRFRRATAIAGGLVFGVLGAGAVVLAGATGFSDHVRVVGLHHTGLLGWIELVFGVFLLAAAASRGGRTVMMFSGVLAVGFGLVILITGRALHSSLGVHEGNALLFILAGAVLAAAGFFAERTAAPTELPDEPRP